MQPKQSNIFSRRELSRRRFLQSTALLTGAAAMGFPAVLRARGVNSKLNVGFIGVGNMGTARLKEILSCDVNVTAFCDVDDNQLATAKNVLPKDAPEPKTFTDFRDLLQSDVDAVVIATPDHWHAPIAAAGLHAGKHVFCEKPLAHMISEARALRDLTKQFPQLATQMGNQGSASPNMRRAIELIQGGAIGTVREVHVWVPPSSSFKAGQNLPVGEDPVPAGMHWNNWIGPSAFHPFKAGEYHPRAWRAWYDFGGGSMADWGCHGLNLPVRALKLRYPTRIETDVPGPMTDGYPKDVRVRFDFAARGELPPVTVWWYDGGRRPPAEIIPQGVTEYYGETPSDGVLIFGDKGYTFGNAHPGANYIQLAGEKKMSGILKHAATDNIAISLPRSPGHLKEWVNACNGGPATFSSFETGGHLTEIALAGVVALRVQKALQWDGEAMRATNVPEAEKFIRAHYRSDWNV
jgi:predicted dehydrogenase